MSSKFWRQRKKMEAVLRRVTQAEAEIEEMFPVAAAEMRSENLTDGNYGTHEILRSLGAARRGMGAALSGTDFLWDEYMKPIGGQDD